jgi:putative addiction module killer protein
MIDRAPRKRKVLHYVSDGKDLFGDWLSGLKDRAGRAAILKRVSRAEDGNLGDRRAVGSGAWEMRVDFGPGYRVYYGEDGPRIILLLCGGDKSTQDKDIRRARELWAQYRRLT